jgi:hypothetical protein
VEDSCEHDNEPSDSIKYWQVLEQLRGWQLLKDVLSSMKLVIYITLLSV